MAIVLPTKGDFAVLDGDDAVRMAADLAEGLFGSSEWRLGIDDLRGLSQRRQAPEGIALAQDLEVREELRVHPDGQEEAKLAGGPPGTTQCEMRMMEQVLAPEGIRFLRGELGPTARVRQPRERIARLNSFELPRIAAGPNRFAPDCLRRAFSPSEDGRGKSVRLMLLIASVPLANTFLRCSAGSYIL